MSHICLFEQRPRLCSDYQQKSNLLNIQILSGWVFECLDGTKLKTKTWNLFIFKIPIRFLLKHLILDVLVVRIRFKIFLCFTQASLNNKEMPELFIYSYLCTSLQVILWSDRVLIWRKGDALSFFLHPFWKPRHMLAMPTLLPNQPMQIQ